MSETQTEQEFRQALSAMVAANPMKVLPVLTRALEENGVRCLVAAVGLAETPQVQMSLTIDDVTMETVKQVAKPVLRKAGFPEDVISVMAGAAGSAVARSLAAQRAKRDQERARVAAATQSRPVAETPSSDARPAWRAGPR